MSDIMKISVTGRCVRDAELRNFEGTDVCQFSVAAKAYGDNETTYWDVSIWGKRGSAIKQYLVKGQPVTVIGNFRAKTVNQNNGTTRTYLQVRADDIVLQGGKRD